MIVIFHWLTHFLYSLCKLRLTPKSDPFRNYIVSYLNSSNHPLAQRDAENDIKFDPPMFKQRYERAAEVLADEKWKNQINKVVDFGCAEFGLFVFLKHSIQARQMVFVDADELLLRDCLYRVYPLNADHLVRRAHAFTVEVFAGSVSDPDPNLSDTDAVVALELIEHLYPDVLEAFPYNLFSYVAPKLAVVTTPNSEFNVLFDKLNKFRHADHKFEWTREQFRSWATNITLRFPNYSVQFDDIGLGPDGSDHLGCCSQLALFIKKKIICDNYVEEIVDCSCPNSTCASSDPSNTLKCNCDCSKCLPKSSYGICTHCACSANVFPKNREGCEPGNYYKLIATIEYPQYVDARTEEEKIFDELKYRMNNVEIYNADCFNVEKNKWEIPINRLLYRTEEPFPSEEEVKNLLLKFNYRIEECLNEATRRVEACVTYEGEMDESGASGSDTEASDYGSDGNKHVADDVQVSDWDDAEPANRENEENVRAQLRLEVTRPGALFDSGYQKSPSTAAEESPTGPLDFKLLGERPTRLSNILSVFDNFDRINELDAVRKEKKYFSFASNLPHREVMKKICQEIGRHPVAGPSRDPKRNKMKKSHSSDSDDSAEDVKAITTCILENSLNTIEIEDEEKQRDHLIRELIPEENVVAEEVAPPVVENGDLANNNRDLEGNNVENQVPVPDDDVVDNVHDVNVDNNNDVDDADEVLPEEPAEEAVEAEPQVDVEVAWSSREALFDANSQVDLLEDFDMDPVRPPVLPQDNSGFPNWLLEIFDEGEGVMTEGDLHDEPHFFCQGDGLGVHPSTVAVNDDDDDDEGNESDTDSSSSGSVDFASAENRSMQELLLPTPPEASRDEDDLAVVGQQLVAVVGAESPEQDVFVNAEASESNTVTNSCPP